MRPGGNWRSASGLESLYNQNNGNGARAERLVSQGVVRVLGTLSASSAATGNNGVASITYRTSLIVSDFSQSTVTSLSLAVQGQTWVVAQVYHLFFFPRSRLTWTISPCSRPQLQPASGTGGMPPLSVKGRPGGEGGGENPTPRKSRSKPPPRGERVATIPTCPNPGLLVHDPNLVTKLEGFLFMVEPEISQ